jgi:hypothetical protein
VATVTNTVTKPGGDVATLATVIIELVAGVEITSGFVSATNVEILGRNTFSAGTDGTWSKSLTANSELTPTGTMYRVTEQAVGDAESRTVRYIVVPAGAGTHPVRTIEYAPVTAVPGVAPSNEVDHAEITANVTGLALTNNLTLVPIPGTEVTVPAGTRVHLLHAHVEAQCATAGVYCAVYLAPVGSTIITSAIGRASIRSNAVNVDESAEVWARLAAGVAGDYQAFVSAASGTWQVSAAAFAPVFARALAV